MRLAVVIRSLLVAVVMMGISSAAFGQVAIGISVGFGPPAIPIYEQPICPEDGYLWTPGFWAYDENDGYYWVPGTWVQPPQVGFLWTPGYWGWGGSGYYFHEGYWGEHVGFYGGINYGFGYGGRGYEGGRWERGRFSYNTYVNRVNTTVIHNTYNTRIENVSENRVSYNGGNGGVNARANSQEEGYGREQHVGRVPAQNEHIQQARSNPELRASANQGRPPIAATAKPADFRTGVVPSREAGAPYNAPEHHANNANSARPNPSHATELTPHNYTPPNTGNPSTDKKYQQQQDKMVQKQNQQHQQLQQQQEREHQQATQKNYNEAQKQQQEQRHAQQTQHMEQQHVQQKQHVQQQQQHAQQSPQQSHPH